MLLERLKRWLGWSSDTGLLDFGDLRGRPRGGSPEPKAPQSVATTRPAESAASSAQRRTKTERTPLDVLDNPKLTLDKPTDDGFDPYNTGAFNRSQSWERIGRQRKR
jgi:hypothetical protein